MPKAKKIKKTILIVEDEEDLREIYKTKLALEGFEVLVADSGTGGVDLAMHNNPDLILLDIILPQKDGFTVLKELKDNPKTKAIPVILLSNLGQDYEIEKGKKLGATDFFIKANFTPKEVLKGVKKILCQ